MPILDPPELSWEFKQDVGSTWIELRPTSKRQVSGHSHYELTLINDRGGGKVTVHNARSDIITITGLVPDTNYELTAVAINRVDNVVNRSPQVETLLFRTAVLGKILISKMYLYYVYVSTQILSHVNYLVAPL